jgi:YCII-related domain
MSSKDHTSAAARHWRVPAVIVPSPATMTGSTQTKEFNGGFTVLDVPSRDAALEWAAKIAAACRCAQEMREFMPDPAVGN